MNLIRLRVIVDIEEDVFRDIVIGRTAPLEDLHRGILAAFDFAEGEMASFFQQRGFVWCIPSIRAQSPTKVNVQ